MFEKQTNINARSCSVPVIVRHPCHVQTPSLPPCPRSPHRKDKPAWAICVSGGYQDDTDHGEWLYYTGEQASMLTQTELTGTCMLWYTSGALLPPVGPLNCNAGALAPHRAARAVLTCHKRTRVGVIGVQGKGAARRQPRSSPMTRSGWRAMPRCA
jgi:hypothetical protein